MTSLVLRHAKCLKFVLRYYSSAKTATSKPLENFQPVFSFPAIRYISLINRLKIYQMIGSAIIVPAAGLMEILGTLPDSFLSAAYIGITGTAVLSLGTLPFKNVIGHLYISEDNKQIKISSVDFWGRRNDRIIDTEEWIPILEMKAKNTDAFYLSPQLTDGTKYKLPIKFGIVKNSKKMGEVLE